MFKSVLLVGAKLLAAMLVAASALASIASGADADEGAPIYVHSQGENKWGVDGLDPGSGNFRYYSPVFAFTQIGDTIYTGGKFLSVTGPGQSVDQPYLSAFSQSGNDWRSRFRPNLDWSVFGLESDADGSRLFVGGEFSSVDGNTDYAGFAALDPTTGALDPSFGVQVARSGGSQPRVHSIQRDGEWLYLAGAFNRITDSTGTTRWTNNVARVNADTGRHDPSWRPLVSGGAVWEIAADPSRGRILLGGLFRRVNGETTAAFAMVDDDTGALEDYDRGFGLRHFNRPNNDYDFVTSIAVTDNRLVIGGQEHRTLVLNPDLSIISIHQTNRFGAYNGGGGGDTQDIVISGNTAFVACHCWGRAKNTDTREVYDVRSVYAIDLRTGEFITSFNPDFSGSSGPWALHIDNNNCLWVGTDATQAGQRRANGVVKLCPQTNLAWGSATATASKPVDGQPASNLVDSDSVTNRPGAASGPMARPYFDIALAKPADIDQVVLWNSTNAQGRGLIDVHLWVSSKPFTTDDWDLLRSDPSVSEITRPANHGSKRTVPIDVNHQGQYLRIQIGTGEMLVLTDLSITGTLIDTTTSPTAPPSSCSVSVNGSTATVTWTGAGNNDQIIYRTASGNGPYWRGRTSNDHFTDELRPGVEHAYLVSTVGAGGRAAGVWCEPNPVAIAEPSQGPTVTTPRVTRDRVVLHWAPAGPVTILRDGSEIATDSDGWYVDRGVGAGTTYEYTVIAADGSATTLVVATMA